MRSLLIESCPCTIERDSGATGVQAVESIAVRDIAETVWQPMAQLIIEYLEEIAIGIK